MITYNFINPEIEARIMKKMITIFSMLFVFFMLFGCAKPQLETTEIPVDTLLNLLKTIGDLKHEKGDRPDLPENPSLPPEPEPENPGLSPFSEPVTPEPENPVLKMSTRYHHYNPDSCEMGRDSVAFVLCPGDSYKSCALNNENMTLHGNQDEGRDVWMLYGKNHLSGTVVCDSDSFFVVDNGMQFGNCK